jgi:hypothetical protein
MKENVGLFGGSCSTCGKKKNAYKYVVGRPVVSRQLVRSRRRWEENIKVGLKELGTHGLYTLTEDRDK